MLEQINFDDWAKLEPSAEKILLRISMNGGAEALSQIGVDDSAITDQVNESAAAWSHDRAAELVGKKWVDGELIDNPSAEWAITESTREMLRADVATAIEEGLSTDQLADELAASYGFSDSRAEMIARTEIADADVQGNLAAYRESGVVEGKEWILASEHNEPDECDDAADMGVVPLDDDFGGVGDPPAHPNCFLGDTLVAALGITAHYRRAFQGKVAVVSIGNDDMAATLNHPILTGRGWVAAGALQVGDDVFQCTDPLALVGRGDPDDHNIVAPIEEIAHALWVTGGVSTDRVPTAAEDFHGDGVADGEVDVVWATCALIDGRQSAPLQNPRNSPLGVGHFSDSEESFARSGANTQLLEAGAPAKIGLVGTSGAAPANDSAHTGSLDSPRSTEIANRQPGAFERVAQCGAVTPEALAEIDGRLTGLIKRVYVTKVRQIEFSGHVYNLETRGHWFLASNIIASNCECDVLPVLAGEGE